MASILLNKIPQESIPDIDKLQVYENQWRNLVYSSTHDLVPSKTEHMILVAAPEDEYLVYEYLDKGHDALWYEVIAGHGHLENSSKNYEIEVSVMPGRNVTLHYQSNIETLN